MSITDYESGILFDAALCTLAMEIMPDYEAAVDKIFNLLKPQGRFAMIGMKGSFRMPYKLGNTFTEWFCRSGAIDLHRHVVEYIKSKCNKVDYEECFGGFYYILSTSKSCLIERM